MMAGAQLFAFLHMPCALQGQIDFVKQVWPILQDRCIECHKAPYEQSGQLKNPKAGLRLDGAAHILRGSDDGKVIKPNHPSESPLYQRIILPEEDDDRMPPKGELLAKAQQEVIRKWIAHGVDFGKWDGATDGIEKFAEEQNSKAAYVPIHLSAYEALAEGLKPLPAKMLANAGKATGALVRPMGLGSPLVEVRFVAESASSGDADLRSLSPLRDHLTKLDLRRTQVTSECIAFVATFPRLTRLDFRDTRVGNANVEKLATLRHLIFLNLTDTDVGDAGLRKLDKCKSLRQVHLWNSQATDSGVESLRRKLRNAKVNF